LTGARKASPPRGGWQLEWHDAGYVAAMGEILGLANETAARPGSTAGQTLGAVVELAAAVMELYYWEGAPL
jgi:hypothetical protein